MILSSVQIPASAHTFYTMWKWTHGNMFIIQKVISCSPAALCLSFAARQIESLGMTMEWVIEGLHRGLETFSELLKASEKKSLTLAHNTAWE